MYIKELILTIKIINLKIIKLNFNNINKENKMGEHENESCN